MHLWKCDKTIQCKERISRTCLMCSRELTFMCYFPLGPVLEAISAENTPAGTFSFSGYCIFENTTTRTFSFLEKKRLEPAHCTLQGLQMQYHHYLFSPLSICWSVIHVNSKWVFPLFEVYFYFQIVFEGNTWGHFSIRQIDDGTRSF